MQNCDLILYMPKRVAIVYSLTSDFHSEQSARGKKNNCCRNPAALITQIKLETFFSQHFVSFTAAAETADLRADAASLVMETDTWRQTCQAPYSLRLSFYLFTQSVSQFLHCLSQFTIRPVGQPVQCVSSLYLHTQKCNTNQE